MFGSYKRALPPGESAEPRGNQGTSASQSARPAGSNPWAAAGGPLFTERWGGEVATADVRAHWSKL